MRSISWWHWIDDNPTKLEWPKLLNVMAVMKCPSSRKNIMCSSNHNIMHSIRLPKPHYWNPTNQIPQPTWRDFSRSISASNPTSNLRLHCDFRQNPIQIEPPPALKQESNTTNTDSDNCQLHWLIRRGSAILTFLRCFRFGFALARAFRIPIGKIVETPKPPHREQDQRQSRRNYLNIASNLNIASKLVR